MKPTVEPTTAKPTAPTCQPTLEPTSAKGSDDSFVDSTVGKVVIYGGSAALLLSVAGYFGYNKYRAANSAKYSAVAEREAANPLVSKS